MNAPANRRRALMRYLTGYAETHGDISPSMREMASSGAVGRSLGNIHNDLNVLERQGHIRRLHNRARAIEVVHPVSIPRDCEGNPLYWVEMG